MTDRSAGRLERLRMPSLGGATAWLNSEPLGPAELRGHVVLVNFWTLTCINWLRTEPYVRAWSQAYRDDGLIVIGVHTPEFSFEHEHRPGAAGDRGAGDRLPGRGRQRLRGLERLRQPLLAGALLRRRGGHHPRPPLRRGPLRAIGARHPAAARRRARARLRRRATGWRRRPTGTTCARPRRISATTAASASRHRAAPRSTSAAPTSSPSACASTTGPSPASGRSGGSSVVLDRAGGSIAYRFHARDAHLVLSRRSARADPVPRAPRRRGSGPVHGVDVDAGRQRRAPGRPPLPARARARHGPRADAGDHASSSPAPEAYVVHLRVGRADGGHLRAARVRLTIGRLVGAAGGSRITGSRARPVGRVSWDHR